MIYQMIHQPHCHDLVLCHHTTIHRYTCIFYRKGYLIQGANLVNYTCHLYESGNVSIFFTFIDSFVSILTKNTWQDIVAVYANFEQCYFCCWKIVILACKAARHAYFTSLPRITTGLHVRTSFSSAI